MGAPGDEPPLWKVLGSYIGTIVFVTACIAAGLAVVLAGR